MDCHSFSVLFILDIGTLQKRVLDNCPDKQLSVLFPNSCKKGFVIKQHSLNLKHTIVMHNNSYKSSFKGLSYLMAIKEPASGTESCFVSLQASNVNSLTSGRFTSHFLNSVFLFVAQGWLQYIRNVFLKYVARTALLMSPDVSIISCSSTFSFNKVVTKQPDRILEIKL